MDGTAALAVLGLRPGATASEISRAFREQAKRTHPDRQGCAAAFHRLRTARDHALEDCVPGNPTPEPPAPAHPSSGLPAPERPAPAAPAGPWLVDSRPSISTFDRADTGRRPVRATPARPPVSTVDPDGLRFVDHLTHALAS